MLTIAALVDLVMIESSSILSNRLLMLRWIKGKPQKYSIRSSNVVDADNKTKGLDLYRLKVLSVNGKVNSNSYIQI